MRLHGSRNRHFEPTPGLLEPSGDPNEIWSFGEESFEILKNLIFIREKLRPYIQSQMDIASEKGYPIMRPMFFEYPDDEICYTLDSQYMFGDDIIFAPIVNQGQRVKTVYIPDGEWILTKDKMLYTKGTYEITAEIDEFIAFVKNGSDVIKCFE
jgi:alpha-D-xyloside xylohydrolase